MKSIIAGKYRITAELGRGSMGMVYKAKHDSLGRVDALKVLHPSLSGDKEFLQRFAREAQAMARLDHLNIVRVYDSFEYEQQYYIAMEYFDAHSVASILESNKKLSVLQVISIISQATSGLAYAHAREIIHRDIKPENILVDASFRVKLTDFGIATAKNEFLDNDSDNNSGDIIGSPRYMSPEQARGEEIDSRSDLYSLGMVFYELISRNSPFQGESGASIINKLARDDQPLELEFASNIPHKIQRIIRTLLHRDPGKRFADAPALQAELAEAMGSEKNQGLKDSGAADVVKASSVALHPLDPSLAFAPKKSRSLTWILLLTLFLVSGAYAYVNQKIIKTQLVALLDFRSAILIEQEISKIEVDRMLMHIRDHESAAREARKKIDESSLTAESKILYEDAVKVQIDGTTEYSEARGLIARAEYDEAQTILLTAEAFFEDAEKQFLLASEAAEKASSLSIVEGLMEEAFLLKQEVVSDKENAIIAKADIRKVAEFKRGTFYQHKADRLFEKTRQFVADKNRLENRLKSRVSIDEAIVAYKSAGAYFQKARSIAQNFNDEDHIEAKFAKFSKLRLIVTTTKIEAEHLGAAIKASVFYEKANAMNKELSLREKRIHKLIDQGDNRRAVTRLDGAIRLASEVTSAYLRAADASVDATINP